MAEYAVELRNVWKRFPGPGGEVVTAVKNVSLQIYDGEFFALLGPSGCGKTTSLRMIAGFELPSEGEIFIHGRPMGKTPPYQRPVNTVFQSYALFPHMTIGENVAFGLQMKGVDKKEIERRVAEALAMVRLSGYEKRKPKQLSGGQQQRVALARALVNRPEVLLLDEPLGALDLKLRKEMQLELKRLQREVGITFIFVTHDQEEALTMSDRIAVMEGGVALQVGTANEIYEHPNCRFVADFIGETNFLDGKVAEIDTDKARIDLPGGISLWAHTPQRVSVGQAVTVTVRPEKMHIRPNATDVNQVTGYVTDIVYIGTDTHYGVVLNGGQTIRVREQNYSAESRLLAREGEEVCVRFSIEAARVLTE
uniref:Spermidine/putrescine import ATP-binding protein PotA n=1 Tax=Caldilinea aerophila TaxID=133453 RepID=A0A7C1JKX3_9CHLR